MEKWRRGDEKYFFLYQFNPFRCSCSSSTLGKTHKILCIINIHNETEIFVWYQKVESITWFFFFVLNTKQTCTVRAQRAFRWLLWHCCAVHVGWFHKCYYSNITLKHYGIVCRCCVLWEPVWFGTSTAFVFYLSSVGLYAVQTAENFSSFINYRTGSERSVLSLIVWFT